MVHGLCMHDRQWLREGHDHGALLAQRLGATPLYLHYNSGLHIATNGQSLDRLLEELLEAWPVPVTEIMVLAHSMGGMVSRSALYYGQQAGHRWPALVKKLVFLGTPHHGAPLERLGNYVDLMLGSLPYTRPFARLGKLRSAGITDLRFGYLREVDWEGGDRFEKPHRTPALIPLPPAVSCYAVAATWHPPTAESLGDGLVPLSSALGQHQEPARTLAFPPAHTLVVSQTHHFDLLNHPDVFAQLKTWLD